MKKEYTKEQRAEYFKALRERWSINKAQSEQDSDAKAKYDAIRKESPTFTISYAGFYFTLKAMQAQGLEGLPYIDAKTFNGWRASGYKVKKGEHSTIDGITWIQAKSKDGNDDDDDAPLYPKAYALFHKSQVEAIA